MASISFSSTIYNSVDIVSLDFDVSVREKMVKAEDVLLSNINTDLHRICIENTLAV